VEVELSALKFVIKSNKETQLCLHFSIQRLYSSEVTPRLYNKKWIQMIHVRHFRPCEANSFTSLIGIKCIRTFAECPLIGLPAWPTTSIEQKLSHDEF
jgi:hypothetical protein